MSPALGVGVPIHEVAASTRAFRRCAARAWCGVCGHVYTHVYALVYTHVYTHVCTHVYTHVYAAKGRKDLGMFGTTKTTAIATMTVTTTMVDDHGGGVGDNGGRR